MFVHWPVDANVIGDKTVSIERTDYGKRPSVSSYTVNNSKAGKLTINVFGSTGSLRFFGLDLDDQLRSKAI